MKIEMNNETQHHYHIINNCLKDLTNHYNIAKVSYCILYSGPATSLCSHAVAWCRLVRNRKIREKLERNDDKIHNNNNSDNTVMR